MGASVRAHDVGVGGLGEDVGDAGVQGVTDQRLEAGEFLGARSIISGIRDRRAQEIAPPLRSRPSWLPAVNTARSCSLIG